MSPKPLSQMVSMLGLLKSVRSQNSGNKPMSKHCSKKENEPNVLIIDLHVSITSIVCKIFETIIRDKITYFWKLMN